MAQKIDRRAAVKDARLRWETAPAHVRALAGAYVGPLLVALDAISEAQSEDQRRMAELAGMFAEFARLHMAGKVEKFQLGMLEDFAILLEEEKPNE